MSIIQVKDLKKVYEYHRKEPGLKPSFRSLFKRESLYREAVRGISFEVERGEVVGFLGPNGAGKTTTLKLLSGILYPTAGRASVLGYTPWERKNEFKRHISVVMAQKNQLWWDLPAGESFLLNRYIYNIDETDYRRTVDELTGMLRVRDLLEVPVRRLSLGERMKMEIISSLLHKPEVILLDEPTIGLDLIAQRELRAFIRHYAQQYQTTILLTSHYMQDIEDLCEHILVINHGDIVYNGSIGGLYGGAEEHKVIRAVPKATLTGAQKQRLQTLGRLKSCTGAEVEMEVPSHSVQACVLFLMEGLHTTDFTISNLPLEDAIAAIYQEEAAHG